jgi:hypothetical protein
LCASRPAMCHSFASAVGGTCLRDHAHAGVDRNRLGLFVLDIRTATPLIGPPRSGRRSKAGRSTLECGSSSDGRRSGGD